jgi:acetylornithine aminotransferase
LDRQVHFSNYYHNQWAPLLAQKLIESTKAFDRVFFCNSGCEANEAAIKFSRKHGAVVSGTLPHPASQSATMPETLASLSNAKHKIVAFEKSFHGRTMGAVSVTHKLAYRAPFAPLVPGVLFGKLNDIDDARRLIDEHTAAVMVEPVQGEGGITPCTADFLQALRELCTRNKALLVFDEIQCGLGRSGKLWAHEHYGGVEADMLTFAKPIAGGLPMGGVLMTDDVASCIAKGDHGTTFGGGPLASRAALAVVERIANADFLSKVSSSAAYLKRRLTDATVAHGQSGLLREIRGVGLLMGIELAVPVAPVIEHARDHGGVLFINAGDNVVRLCPPLVISDKEIDQAVDAIAGALDHVSKNLKQQQ